MVFRRKRFRRRGFKRRRTGFGGRSTRKIARKALRGVRRINRSVEVKRLSVATSVTSVNNTPQQFDLHDNIVQGLTAIDRVGVKITNVGLQMRFHMYQNDTVATGHTLQFYALALVLDKYPLATPRTFQEIFAPTPPLTGTNSWPFKNWYNRKKFKVLKYKTFARTGMQTFSSAGAFVATGNFFFKRWEWRIKLRGMESLFGIGAGIQPLTKNGLLLWVWSNDGVANREATLDFEWQLFFTDS